MEGWTQGVKAMLAASGHGHVVERTDGTKARCGGPGMCEVCSKERRALDIAIQKDIDRPAILVQHEDDRLTDLDGNPKGRIPDEMVMPSKVDLDNPGDFLAVGKIAEERERFERLASARRAWAKAWGDCSVFGTGCVFISADGSIKHVPIHEIPVIVKEQADG